MTSPTKHIAVAIISKTDEDNNKRYLLISSKKDYGKYTGFYYPPGGHIEQNETEEQALVRELKEELSIEIEPVKKISETAGDVPNQTTHWWDCKIKNGTIQINPDDVIGDARFVSIKEMEDMHIWPATRKFFAELN